MPQSEFQRRAFAIAQQAHSAADRADARILMSIVDAIDERDFESLPQLTQAVQAKYRSQLGDVPSAADILREEERPAGGLAD